MNEKKVTAVMMAAILMVAMTIQYERVLQSALVIIPFLWLSKYLYESVVDGDESE